MEFIKRLNWNWISALSIFLTLTSEGSYIVELLGFYREICPSSKMYKLNYLKTHVCWNV